MTKDDMEIVSALRAALADKVGTSRFALWFGDSTRFAIDRHTLTVSVPTAFFRDWIRTNFRRHIEQACLAAVGRSLKVEFEVVARDDARNGEEGLGSGRDESGGNGQPPRLEKQATRMSAESAQQEPISPPTAGKKPSSLARQTQNTLSRRTSASRHDHQSTPMSPTVNRAAAEARMPDGGRHRRRVTLLDDFVEGEGNRIALSTARRVARAPGAIPLYLHGPTSVGKTHLLEGILAAARRQNPRITAVYQSAEQFTSQFIEALRGSGLPSFRRKYRGVDMLILDDLQFFIGKRATRTELLHTVDSLMREGRQVVFAADRPPEQLTNLGNELVTRLRSGTVCSIELPDYATRLGIVGQMARRLDVDVPDDVQQYIAARVTSHAREISGALCRLQATSEALAKPIDLEMAKRALSELIRQGGPVVRLPDIERAVCDVLDIDAGSLQGPSRSKRVSHPRMLAMWLARKHTRAALSEIGTYFGRRRHSTVLSAQRRIDDWMAVGGQLEVADRQWDVDDAIRLIERRLRAG